MAIRAQVLLLVSLMLSSCSQDESPTPPTDAVTSATPGVPTAWLEPSHTGWNQTDCVACHGHIHDSGYRLPDCTGCHGLNGSPLRDRDHADQLCEGCHAGEHRELHFQSPSDCRRCHGFQPTESECAYTEAHEVVVVGAGGGGLAAAATLALAGVDVIVLERHYKVGGMMVTFQRGDFTFEASLHGYDGLNEVGGGNVTMFKNLEIWDRLRPIRLDPMYRAIFPEHDLEIPADVDDYLALLQEQFPDEAEGLERLFAEMERRNEALSVGLAVMAGEELPEDFDYSVLLELQEMMEMTLTEFVGQYIQDERIISIWTQLCGFAGTEASRLSAVFFMALWNSYHHGGYYYFEGGSQSIVDAMAEVILENGGRIELNTEVVDIAIDGSRATGVRAQDGRCFEADFVISNAPAPLTLLELVGREHLPAADVEQVESLVEGASTFLVFIGADQDYSELFGDSHEMMIAPSYSESENMNAINGCDMHNVGMALTNYTMVDPATAPAGSNVITITTLAPYDCFGQWRWSENREAYLQQKDEITQILLERAEAHLPDLRSHLVVVESATPHTIRGFTLAPRGSIVGWDNTIEQSLTQRLPRQTAIENLLLAGAWTFPGGGQSAVMMSGVMSASDVIDGLSERE
jgi:all-trans-retinol 13,14-reductase